MIEVVTIRKLGTAITTPLLCVQRAARLKDSVEVFESDDLVLYIVIFGGDGILEFRFKGRVEQLQMFPCFFVCLCIQRQREFCPSMDEGIERCLEN